MVLFKKRKRVKSLLVLILVFNILIVYKSLDKIRINKSIRTNFNSPHLVNNISAIIEHGPPVQASDQWVFNFNVSQYSSIISGDYGKDLLIESMIFSDTEQDPGSLNKNLKCYLKIGDLEIIEDLIELFSIELM